MAFDVNDTRRIAIAAALLLAPMLLPERIAAQAEGDGGQVEGRHVTIAVAARLTTPIQLDGRLDDAAWSAAQPVSGFIQREPDEGMPARQDTEVRVLFDDNAIYVGARMHDDDPALIGRRLVRRDSRGSFDYFGVMFDPDRDGRTAYAFLVSAVGVQRDVYLFDDVHDDDSWNAVWEAETAFDDDGWTAELRIPLSQLRYDPGTTPQTWGVNFTRRRIASNETSYFAPESPLVHGKVSRFGRLSGLQLGGGGTRVEIKPYALARAHTAPAETGNPFFDGSTTATAFGADARYGLGTAFTLDATLNPDFGQVEVDPAVINLTAFETFFPEKRPFFVEDARVFDFSLAGRQNTLFYSRRIGRSPRGGIDDASFVDVPDQTTILGAAKLTGRTSGNLSVGALAAVTQAEQGRAYFASGDSTASFLAEPRGYYGVVRARQDLNQGATQIGGIVTGMGRALPEGGAFDFLTDRAFSAGLDFEHTWNDREWALSGFLALSRIHGSNEALIRAQTSSNHYFQRPDATDLAVDSTATSMSGAEWRLELSRRGGGHWTGGVWLGERTPGFEINDLGYVQGSERLDAGARISYQSVTPGRLLRTYHVNFMTFHNWRHEALRDPLSWNAWSHAHKSGSFSVNADLTFLNYWGMNIRTEYQPRLLSDGLTRGGPLMVDPSSVTFSLRGHSDRRSAITLEPSLQIDRGRASDRVKTGLQLTVKPAPGVELQLQPSYERSSGSHQFVATAGDAGFAPTFGSRYLFADIDRREVSLETRLDVAFSRSLTLQLFAQPLLSAGDYTTFKQLARPGTDAFDPIAADRTYTQDDERFIDFDGNGAADFSFPVRDFNIRSLRGNAVMRWEYRPGSTLYLVWQQSRSFRDTDPDSFSTGTGTRALLDLRPENIFIVKVNYWLGL